MKEKIKSILYDNVKKTKIKDGRISNVVEDAGKDAPMNLENFEHTFIVLEDGNFISKSK